MSEPQNQPEEERGGASRPVIVAAVVFALVAAGVVAFLLAGRDDDSSEERPGAPEALDLAAPLYNDGSTANQLHLVVEPVREGDNRFTVRLTQGGDLIEPLDVELDGVDLYLVPLNDADRARQFALTRESAGTYQSSDEVTLDKGWWEATVTLYPSGENPRSIPFYLRVPDPNLNETDFEQEPGSSEAKAFFDAGLARLLQTHSVKYIERITQGDGAVSIVQREVTEGINGTPPATRLVNAQFELITIGDKSFQRNAGNDWFEREPLPIFPLSEWGQLYTNASNFELGESVLINNRPTQIITFYVPESQTLFPAWYAWWIDVETGYVIREAMISTWHYMIYEFGEFDQPVNIENPIAGAKPEASPAASPLATPLPSPSPVS